MPENEYKRLKPLCGVDECGRVSQARDLCNTHYSRWRKTGTTEAPAAFVPAKCSAIVCTRESTRRGLCAKHYSRWLQHGSPEISKKPVRKECTVCSKPAKGHGLCPAHLYRLKRNGAPTASWRETNPKKPCAVCQGPISDFPSEAHCSHRCAHRAKKGQSDSRPCAECRLPFKSLDGAKTCSDACSEVRRARILRQYVERQKAVPAYAERRRMAQQRRRAKIRALEVEDFTFQEIAGRDRWRCGVCGLRVKESAKYPDPMSGSIDHITPIVKGGGHTRVNVQLAHLRCNMQKQSKVQGQLLLIG